MKITREWLLMWLIGNSHSVVEIRRRFPGPPSAKSPVSIAGEWELDALVGAINAKIESGEQ